MIRLKNKIKTLEDKFEKQAEVIEFLCNYNKDAIIVKHDTGIIYGYPNQSLRYLYGGTLHKVDINQYYNRAITVYKNMYTEAILQVSSCTGTLYVMLDKATEQLTQLSADTLKSLQSIPGPTLAVSNKAYGVFDSNAAEVIRKGENK